VKFVVNEGHDPPFVWIDLSTPLNQRPNLGPISHSKQPGS